MNHDLSLIMNRAVCTIACLATMTQAKIAIAADLTQSPAGGVTASVTAGDPALLGDVLTDEEQDARGGLPLIVIVIVRGATKVVVTTCSKSSACSSTAASVAKKLGGAVVGAFFGGAAYNNFCASQLGAKYGHIGKICR